MQAELTNQNQSLEGQTPEAGLIPTEVIRTETILSRLPVHNLAKRGRVDINIVRQSPAGELELKWIVSYSDRYGQARQLAYKLDTIVVDQAIDEAGKPLPQFLSLGSLRDIANQLDLGGDTNKVRRALRQNASAFIVAKFKYRSNDGVERTFEADFTRYGVVFTGEKLPDGRQADQVYLVLNDPYREVLNNAPMRPLNFEYKKQLAPAAQRFYEVVSYKMFAALKFNHPEAQLLYSEYCTSSGQQRYFDYDHFKKQMYKIHLPHLQSGYLLKTRYQDARDEQGRADWLMCYVAGPKARAEYATFTGKKPRAIDAARPDDQLPMPVRRPRQRSLKLQPEVNSVLLAELTRRGVGESDARKELSTLPADFPVLDVLEYADQEINRPGSRIETPTGFYISLLRKRSLPPPTFQSSAVRKAQQEAVLREQQAIQERREREEAERQAAEAQLDQFKLDHPAWYQELYDIIKKEIIGNNPFLAAADRKDSSIHDGSIRSRMRHRLQSYITEAIARDFQRVLTTPQLPAPAERDKTLKASQP